MSNYNGFKPEGDIYLIFEKVDFRMCVNGLTSFIQEKLDVSLFSRACFLFCNRGCDKIKIIEWDFNGFWMYYKRLDISNNKAERGIKHFVIGRKNFLFSDSAEGADSCGITYSIVETAKANNLNPQKYLEFLLEELSRNRQTPEKLEEVMPWSNKIPEEIKVKNPIIK